MRVYHGSNAPDDLFNSEEAVPEIQRPGYRKLRSGPKAS